MAHICLIIPNLGGGGAERAVLSLARGLCAQRHRVDLVLFAPEIAYPEEVPEAARLFVLCGRSRWEWRQESGIPANTVWSEEQAPFRSLFPELIEGYERMPLAGYTLLRRNTRAKGLRLLSYIEHERPDILFPNIIHAEYMALFAAEFASTRPPVVPIIHGIERLNRKHRYRRRRFLPFATHVVAVSRGVAEDICVAHRLAADRITVIYNPAFRPEVLQRAEEPPEHPWFGDGGPPVILGVGRLAQVKDFLTLIEAFRRVLAERPCRLLILGEGPMRSELESRILALGLEPRVSLPGWKENPYAFMAGAKLFVLSSRYEGFGLVLVEALACGCPAVSTDCPGGPAEILEDPTLLAPVGDPEALAKVMLRALARPMDKAVLQAKAARFSIEPAMDGYEKLISEILARQGGSKPT